MKLLLDEMFSPTIAEILRKHGHDVIAVSGSGQEASPDDEILEYARSQQRAIFTANVEHFRILHGRAVKAGREGHHGIVLLAGRYSYSRADTGRMVAALEELLNAHPGDDDLVNGEIWLRPE